MTVMNISLSEDMKQFIEAQVAEEGYASASEYLHAVLEDIRRRKAKRDLFAKLDEAIASGPAEPMTREDWDSLERKVWERHHRGQTESPSPS
jgi:antitoxin ParD1/3/4